MTLTQASRGSRRYAGPLAGAHTCGPAVPVPRCLAHGLLEPCMPQKARCAMDH